MWEIGTQKQALAFGSGVSPPGLKPLSHKQVYV